ncbi:prolyl oligopeptidase family serine peptidase [Actinomadura sp. HBU206391]|uniref:prolyl oligopeptidase family serine peptidase n=1 Tax=Actinomadura sp. HBU206391 TaxID=2731692 RepID=UPI0016505291|nr:prolyl oligopeptidase family serine peptidase [Actinomadura sp. HBU206391]MBC6458715.1 S9 family peptidase [Actinomadura sp. HBU206391]
MSRPTYPAAQRQDIVEDLHGHQVADPYRWLEDPQSDDTKRWLTDQDELFHQAVDGLPGRERLRARLTDLLGSGSIGSPVWRGDRRFFVRRAAEQEHAVLYTVGADGGERILLDPMAIDDSGRTTLDAWQPDKEGRLLAYQLSHGGDEESLLRVMDVATGEDVEGPIERCRYSQIAWLPGGAAFYYVRRLPAAEVPDGEDQYHRRVYLHRVGSDPETDDVMIFGEGREKTNYYGVSVSRDGRWLALSASQGTAPRNELWIADLTASPIEAPALKVLQEGVDAETGVYVGRDGRAYIFTDRDAPRARLCVTDPADPSYETWRDLIPEDPEAVLSDFAILDGPELERPVLLAGWTRHAISEITVHDLVTGERIGEVPTPGLGSIGGIVERPEGGHEAWFGYTDNVTPTSVQRYDARTGETSLWQAAPGTVDLPDVQAEQITYESYDGTEVRMLVISRADVAARDEPRPTILYGYGGFNVSLTPSYSPIILTWVEAGGVYVIANVRGGAEEGEEWHRAGMLARKQAVFDDFHAAAEKLIADGWTTPERLAISGGSNGGLLVGAALTQRPELYRAVVCSAPLLDMVRYERFGLGQTWNVEYGSAEVPEQLGWLLGYSPYHHVREGVEYPATLFTVFDSDTRVDPLHARKMCAALQHATASAEPILLRNEAEVGHGARAVSRTVQLAVDTLSFMAARTGLDLET